MLHGYSVDSYIMFIHHYYIDSLVYIRWLFLYYCYTDHCSYYMDIPVFFYMTISCYWYRNNIPVTGYKWCWYAMCETKCHMDLSHRASRIPPLLFFVFRYLVSWYQQSSCHIIILHVTCTVIVPDTLCSLNIINITWEYGRLDDWLDLIGWISWIHVYPTAWDGSAGYWLYIASWAPISCPSLSGGLWSQQPGVYLGPWSQVCAGYTHPIKAPWPSSFQLT